MNRLLSKIVLTIAAPLAASGINAQSQEPFWLGADISGTTEMESRGAGGKGHTTDKCRRRTT